MSGICGILRLDGAAPDGVAAMAAALERRGPEGTRLWRDGPIAFGHTLLATTPEALREVLPLTDPTSGCSVVADARLDNREELLAALGLPLDAGDSELILRAWLAWGEGAPDRLLGDFAFVLWDSQARRLFAARDPMGMRPLAYAHLPGRLFAFASEARAVQKAEGVPRGLDEGRVADFLGDNLEGLDYVSTFHKGVFRLPSAHHLSVDERGLAVRRYWTPTPASTLRLPSDEAYAAAFREVFTEAVRCRLRGAGPVGSMLSGGMDSGSIVATASRLLAEAGGAPLPTFSVVGPDPATCAETRAIHAALALPNLDPHIVPLAQPEVWRDGLIRDLHELGEPFDGHVNLLRAVYRAAKAQGVKVVLDGGGGDVVLSHGDRIPRLLRDLCWREAWRETKASRLFWGYKRPVWRLYLNALRQAATPGWARRVRIWFQNQGAVRDRRNLLDRRFAQRIGLGERLARQRAHAGTDWLPTSEKLARSIAQPFLTAGRERYDRVAAAFGIEPRDPFLDRRVIEFCLRLPSEQLEARGWPKILLRRAMTGLLPEEVLWRRGKEHLGADLTQALFDAWPGWSEALESASPRLRPYLRPQGDTAPFRSWRMPPDVAEQWELLYLALWLDGPERATTNGLVWDRSKARAC